jgi:hypothetical protein
MTCPDSINVIYIETFSMIRKQREIAENASFPANACTPIYRKKGKAISDLGFFASLIRIFLGPF